LYKESGVMENINITEKDGEKYIDGEKVLYEYDCWTNWIVIRFFLFLFLTIGLANHYFFRLHQYDFESFFVVGFLLLLFVGWGYIDIKTALNRGIYITQKHLITFSGKKISLQDVYYRWGAGGVGTDYGSTALKLYSKNHFLLSCLVKDNDENYIKMIDILMQVSNNIDLKTISKRDAKRKLIKTI
jgi:hypothetical protein